MKKFCTKCGKPFESIGREVICPACKEHAAEAAKRAAVLKAKRASWAGESVPVRISGRASTIIREYGAEKGLPFAASLDALLKSSAFFKNTGKTWEEVEPYKSRRRRDKHTTETAQDVQEVKQEEVKTAASKPQDVPQAAKQASKTTSKAAGKPQASKPQASKPQASKPQEVKQDEPAKPVKAKTVKK